MQKYIIAEEELVGGGQSRPPRPSGAAVQRPGVQSASASRPATGRQNSFKSPTAGSQRHAPGGQRPPYRPPMQTQYQSGNPVAQCPQYSSGSTFTQSSV